eukprot:evm.model.scf_245.7 EVM.evm.TU.scf_245.7   scf_245:58319-62110(-)
MGRAGIAAMALAALLAAAVELEGAAREDDCDGPEDDQLVNLHRLWNPSPAWFDHFYTAHLPEAVNARDRLGFTHEGLLGKCFAAQRPSTVPLYRLFRPDAGQRNHFYTVDVSERDALHRGQNYTEEGVECWVYEGPLPCAVPVYRSFNPAGDHFYTGDFGEVESFEGAGWAFEGVAFYVLPPHDCPKECEEDGVRGCRGGDLFECREDRNLCLKWERLHACKDRCHEGQCYEECRTECTSVGEAVCRDGAVAVCAVDAVGCRVWEERERCPDRCHRRRCEGYCMDQCPSVGERICTEAGVVECAVDEAGCRRWTTRHACDGGCRAGECQTAPRGPCGGQCPSVGDVRCGEAGVLECVVDEAGCRKWERRAACAHRCQEGQCLGDCEDRCPWPGELKCEDGGVLRCVIDANGCRKWELAEMCSNRCHKGECQEPCHEQCPSVGDLKCGGGSVFECRFDAQGCRQWERKHVCSVRCNKGLCRDACGKQCPAEGDRTCDEDGTVLRCVADESGCRGWERQHACEGRCFEGLCQEACDHQCQAAGDKTCYESGVLQCVADEGGCRRLEKIHDCPERCHEGQCLEACDDQCPSAGEQTCGDAGVLRCAVDDGGCLQLDLARECEFGCETGACLTANPPSPSQAAAAEACDGENCPLHPTCHGDACAPQTSIPLSAATSRDGFDTPSTRVAPPMQTCSGAPVSQATAEFCVLVVDGWECGSQFVAFADSPEEAGDCAAREGLRPVDTLCAYTVWVVAGYRLEAVAPSEQAALHCLRDMVCNDCAMRVVEVGGCIGG